MCTSVCVVTVMKPKSEPTAPTAGLPWSVALGWLVCVCVYVCVWNSCSPVLHGEGQGGDTDELQLWPWGLWELWLEQCGKGIRGKRKDERGREEKRFTGKRSVYKLRQDEMAKWRENTRQREKKTPEKRRCPSVSECSEAGKATETSRRRGPRHNLATRSLQRDMGLEARRQWALIQWADPEPSTAVT